MFSPHTSVGGGVVSFVDSLTHHFGPGFHVEHFRIGQRRGKAGGLLRLLYPVYDACRLIKTITLRSHDIYHINPSLDKRAVLRDGLFLIILKLFRRRNVLVFIHGWDPEFYDRIQRDSLLRALFVWAYRHPAVILVLADAFKQGLAALGLPEARISVSTTMFKGVDIPKDRPDRSAEEFRLLFLARFVPLKGIFPLLEAFRSLSSKHPEMILILAGDGPEHPRIVDWCRAHGIIDKVQLPGYVTGPEKSRLLGSSDVFVLPSFREGCPISLLEAMASGLPVVVTPVGGVPGIVRDGENGLLIAVDDSGAIAHAIEALWNDPALRQCIGARNKQKAWAHYEAGNFTREMEQRYRAVAELGGHVLGNQ